MVRTGDYELIFFLVGGGGGGGRGGREGRSGEFVTVAAAVSCDGSIL